MKLQSFLFLSVSLFSATVVANGIDGSIPLSSFSLEESIDAPKTHSDTRKLANRRTITQIVEKDSSFDTLATALKATGLNVTLSGSGPFTVLAPSDRAFAKLGDSTIKALLKDKKTLSNILLYHVISGRVLRKNLRNDIYKAVNGDNLRVGFFRNNSAVINESVDVTTFNIFASNGVVHVINEVLIPPKDIVGVIKSDKRFSTLAAAVEAAGLTLTLKSMSDEFTIFAPTNSAFKALGTDTVNALLKDPQTLKSILLYHSVDGSVLRSDLKQSGGRVKTLEGSNFHFRYKNRVLLINDSKVIRANILAANGVIHAIDKVLTIPN